MDGRSSVLALTLAGVGASAGLVGWRQRQRRQSVYSASRARELCSGAIAAQSDSTHRDGSASGSELRARFQDNGYVIVEDVFTEAEMAAWKLGIQEQLARWPQSSVDPSTGREVSATTTGVSVWMAAGEDPSSAMACPPFFIDALTSPKLGRIIAEILGDEPELLSTKPVLKTGKIAHASPWHQDYPYWKGTNKLSLWVAIDNAQESNGCLKVVPRSHGEELPHEQHTEAIAFDSRVDSSTIQGEMDVPLRKGSLLIFHDMLLHASNPNSTGADRYCMIPTYRGKRDGDPDPLGVWPAGGVDVRL